MRNPRALETKIKLTREKFTSPTELETDIKTGVNPDQSLQVTLYPTRFHQTNLAVYASILIAKDTEQNFSCVFHGTLPWQR